jgi:hypothetical protein
MKWLTAAAAIVIVVVLATAFVLIGSAARQAPRSAPTPRATKAPRPTPTPPDPRILEVARDFTAGYLDYDWSQPAGLAQAIGPYVTQRLYGQLQDGTGPDGRPAPWTQVAPSLHEIDSVQIGAAAQQVTGADSAAVQLQVVETARTDAGQSSTPKQIDLTLQQESGAWEVDWVSERSGQ